MDHDVITHVCKLRRRKPGPGSRFSGSKLEVAWGAGFSEQDILSTTMTRIIEARRAYQSELRRCKYVRINLAYIYRCKLLYSII